MTKKNMAFDRVKHMDDEELSQYITTLEHDLSVKQTKAQRLAKDIQRHERILAVAGDEAEKRGTKRSAYKNTAVLEN